MRERPLKIWIHKTPTLIGAASEFYGSKLLSLNIWEAKNSHKSIPNP